VEAGPGDGEAAETEQIDRKTTLLEMPMWTKPEYSEMRFGFEVTMYIANR
jgi:coenzyme PQQ precursor peptide PqqA